MIAGVTSAAIIAVSVTSALASRAGTSSQPFGGGSRPTCDVLIRDVFLCIVVSSLVPAGQSRHDHSMEIAIEPVMAPTPEATELLAELDATLAAAYPPHQRHGLSLDELFLPEIRFFVARVDGAAMGCGGVALLAGFAEVKRMYTRPAARRRGVGMALLTRIEAEARRAGRRLLRLETGTDQAAAIGLYERWGFCRCAAFGRYAALPAERIAGSLFYEKPV
jgi:putative acetyltransferase